MSMLKKMTSPPSGRWIVPSTATFVVVLAIVGCGETAPAPLTKEEFVEAKQEREKIISKEYGEAAYKKAVSQGKAGIK